MSLQLLLLITPVLPILIGLMECATAAESVAGSLVVLGNKALLRIVFIR